MKKFWLAAAAALLPSFAEAHGIGVVYALPIPFRYYSISAAFAVAFSFIILGLFYQGDKKSGTKERRFRLPLLRPAIFVVRVIAVVLLFVCIISGFVGRSGPSYFTPVFFWVYFLVGMGILSVVCSNLWHKISPFESLFVWLRLERGTRQTPWSVAPTVLFGMTWLELVSFHSYIPAVISGALGGYLVLNLIAGSIFSDWFIKGEFFSVMYGCIGSMSHLSIDEKNASLTANNGAGKLDGKDMGRQFLSIAALLLAGATFDGLKETAFWFRTLKAFGITLTQTNLMIANSTGLLLVVAFFLASFYAALAVARKVTGEAMPTGSLVKRFALSLVPIAFGYMLAHNFSLLIVTGPQMLALISDPFNLGWNLFGTAADRPTGLILGAKAVWFIEIGFILLGHVVGVVYAHVIAHGVFKNARTAFMSQYSMLALMILYTILTLWLISEPLVTR